MQAPSELDLLKEAYGHFCFKCPTFACPEYQQGFPSRQERDIHAEKHIRKYKCPSEECDFHRIGFISQKTLDAHVLYFHETITLAYRFPALKPQSGLELLEEAVDQDDPDLVQSLLLQIKDVSNAQKLLERAVKKGSQNSACVLLSFAQFDKFQLKKMLRLTAIGGQSKISSTILSILLSILSDQEIRTFLSGKLIKSSVSSNDFNNLRTIIAKSNAPMPWRWRPALEFALSSNLHDIRSLILDNAAKLGIGRRDLEYSAEKLAKRGDRDGVRLLLSQALQLKSSSERDFTKGLKAASAQGIDAMVDLVMGKGSGTVNAKGKTFGCALQKEALAGNDERVIELLDSGADIENSDSYYGTALAAAARKGNISTMRILFQRGADPQTSIPPYLGFNLPPGMGVCSAIDIAARQGELAAVQLLLEHDAGVGSALLLTAQSGNLDLARDLIKAGADPSAYCSQLGWTPLHGAAYEVQKDMALLLLDNGASIHTVTEPCKESALHLAIHPPKYSHPRTKIDQYHEKEKRRLALVRSLLDRGADVMTKDSKGNTPLHTFFASGFEIPNAEVLDTTLAMLQSLIERGADLKSTNDQGQTPRDMVIALAYGDRGPKKLIEIIDPKPDNENGQANERSEQQLEPQW
jgi:ankyrin repeat protein